MFFPQHHDGVGNAGFDTLITWRMRYLTVTFQHWEVDPSPSKALVDALRLPQWFPNDLLSALISCGITPNTKPTMITAHGPTGPAWPLQNWPRRLL